jgi:eukaryotic-like serine/threonine-protein kinase
MSQLTWFDRSGKRLGAVGEPGQYETFCLSPDGRLVVGDRGTRNGSDLWLLDTGRGVASRFTARPGRRSNFWPVWSPDGRTIIFTSTETNLRRNAAGGTLYRKEAGGTGDGERLIDSNGIQLPTDWSRDGKYLFYSEITEVTANTVAFQLWVLPVAMDGKPTGDPRPYLRSQFDEFDGRFSPQPNPRWVAYQSDESGRGEIYVDAFPAPRNKVRISTDGGWDPQWSPDGRELFYLSFDGKLMGASLKAAGHAIEASAPRELFAPPILGNVNGYDAYIVAPDGRFLIRSVPEGQASQPLTLLSNWPALLKQAPAAP